MSNGITRDEMRDLFEQYFKKGSGADSSRSGPDSANGDPKTYNELIKKIKETTESLKKQIPANGKLSRLLNGQRQQYIDSRKELEEFDKQLNELTVTAKDQADLNKKLAEKKVLQEKRDTAATAISQANARAAVANFSMTVGTVAQTLLKGAFQYAKDLQSGASGVEAGSNAAMTAATATGEAISGFGSLLQGIGLAIGAVFKKLPFIGPALAVAGVGLEVFGKKASDVSKDEEEEKKEPNDGVKILQEVFGSENSSSNEEKSGPKDEKKEASVIGPAIPNENDFDPEELKKAEEFKT